jgi:hypothetical protein
LLRIGGEKAGIPEWNYVTPNMFAGSIFNLRENTAYECRLILEDPDGAKGEKEKIITFHTRKEPQAFNMGRIRHVFPENPVGEEFIIDSLESAGEKIYTGLLHAYYGYERYADWVLTTDPVQPGDIIIFHKGIYKADPKDYRDVYGLTFDGIYNLTQDGTEEKPILIKSAGDGEVIFDGNGAHNLFNLMGADYHIIEGITIQNCEYGIIAGKMNLTGCDGLAVKNCVFRDIGIGIHGVYEGSKNYYIADNYFFGREDTIALIKTRGESRRGGINQVLKSYYAVKVYGQGHIICHNLVKWFFDGIDICTHSGPEKEQDKKAVSIDIYNNDIFLCNDNFIEADGGMHNIRIFRNRGYNAAQAGWSSQPALGGPVYWIRNVGINTPFSSAMKWWGMNPAGVIAWHNSFATFNTRFFNPCSNVHFRNNIFIPPDDDAYYGAFSLYSYTSYSSSDHNAYRIHEGMENPVRLAIPEAKLVDYDLQQNFKEFNSIESLGKETGFEDHGIEVGYADFIRLPKAEYQDYFKRFGVYPLVYPHEQDFIPLRNSKLVDAGCRLDNINDNYTGDAPDIGAYELGLEKWTVGPRHKK